eukprot:gene641-1309_t
MALHHLVPKNISSNLISSLAYRLHTELKITPKPCIFTAQRFIPRRRRRNIGIPKPRGPTKTAKDAATISAAELSLIDNDEISNISDKLSLENLVRYRLQKSSALVDPGSVYQKLPNKTKTVVGETPVERFLWEEKDWPNGFPDSPEEANTDVLTYLEQKDMFRRRQVIHMPKFCVGSIVAVTRAEPFSPKGSLRFVGICIEKKHHQNTLRASFVLRNVIANEPVEINFELYSPLIQKIEVLKHERRTNYLGKEDLTYLRDHPAQDSTVDENMKALPYTEEPSEYMPRPRENIRLQKWFKEKFRQKNRRRNKKT